MGDIVNLCDTARIFDDSQYPYRTMGISNICIAENGEILELMFYDYDAKPIDYHTIQLIKSYFPNDCLIFESSDGFHFVSLAISYDNQHAFEKANELSRRLEQDYSYPREAIAKKYGESMIGETDIDIKKYMCVLRIAPKRYNSVGGDIFKPRPTFAGVLKYPDAERDIISKEHILTYSLMGIPNWLLKKYAKCEMRQYRTKYFYYYATH